MIRVDRLRVRAGLFTIDDISIDVPTGESLVILGPSGAGKTLLLETIVGLRHPDAGRVIIDGEDVTQLPPEARGVAYMPQDVALFPHLSVRENILFGRRARGTMTGADEALHELADTLGVAPLLDRTSVRTLSGGERQRVALARALIVQPRVMFLDESFSGLDAHVRHDLQEQFRTLQRALGLTVVYVTHSHEESFLLADKVAVIMDGRCVQVACPDDLFAAPRDLRIARLLRLPNVLSAEVVETTQGQIRCRIAGAFTLDLPHAPAPSFHVAIPPEEVEILEPSGAPADALEAVVVGDVAGRRRGVLKLRIGEASLICAAGTRRLRELDARTGTTVRVRIATEGVSSFISEG